MRLAPTLLLLFAAPAMARAPSGTLEAGWMGTRVCTGSVRPADDRCTLVTKDQAQHLLGGRQVLVASGSPPPDAHPRRHDMAIAAPLLLLPIQR